MTEEDVRRIVMSMKGCLAPSHIACEKCSPGFNKRIREAMTGVCEHVPRFYACELCNHDGLPDNGSASNE